MSLITRDIFGRQPSAGKMAWHIPSVPSIKTWRWKSGGRFRNDEGKKVSFIFATINGFLAALEQGSSKELVLRVAVTDHCREIEPLQLVSAKWLLR